MSEVQPIPDAGDEPATAAYRRAAMLVDNGRPRDAIPILQRAIASNPGKGSLFRLASLAHLRLREYVAARDAAYSAIRCEPENETAWRYAGTALVAMGALEQATECIDRALALAPNSYQVQLAMADLWLAKSDPKRAGQHAERARELAPNDARVYVTLSLVALRLRRWTLAERHCRHALQINPENAAALNNLGVVYLKTGRRRQAITLFARASRLNPAESVHRRNAMRFAGPSTAGAAILVYVLLAADIGGGSFGPIGLLAGIVLAEIAFYRLHPGPVWRLVHWRRPPDGVVPAGRRMRRELVKNRSPEDAPRAWRHR